MVGLALFTRVGYIENGRPAKPPETVTLYRGGVQPDRMAWTSSKFVAEWFRDLWANGQLLTGAVDAGHLLMHSNNVRLDESGRSEDEYVINPDGVTWQAL